MAFSSALYYPWIDIRNEAWLKSAILYWEKIRTIVPESIRDPYSSDVVRAAQDAGVILPVRVTPDMEDIENLTDDVVEYLDSAEAAELLIGDRLGERVFIHDDKLPHTIRRLVHMHPDKLSHEVRYLLRQIGIGRPTDDGWHAVDTEFANYYMTLLATRLADRLGLALLADRPASHRLSTYARMDAPLAGYLSSRVRRQHEYDAMERRRHMPRELAQGFLVDLIIEDVAVAPDTPVSTVLDFRRQHADELGRFRQAIARLTSSIPDNSSAESLRQSVRDAYENDFMPALGALRQSLESRRIRWLTGDLLKIAFISVGSTSVLAGLGLSIPNALLVGAGISMVGSGILYNVDRREALAQSPYSYVLSMEKTLR